MDSEVRVWPLLSGPAVSAGGQAASNPTLRQSMEDMGFNAGHCYSGYGKGRSGQLHVLSCYAPTLAASREDDKFFDLLQDALSAFHQRSATSC